MSVSDLIRQAVTETIEDEIALAACRKAVEAYHKNPKTCSLEDAEKELGLRMFHVILTDQAGKQLKKMDRHVSSLLPGSIRKNPEGCDNPGSPGKALTRDKAGASRYRIGDYRIHDEMIVILVLSIVHQREVYR